MLFQNLTRISVFERSQLKFIRSREDWNIVIAIGNAGEQGVPIGFKQLALQEVASPSTLTRKLKLLIAGNVVRRVIKPNDGRMVAYTLSKPTVDAFRRYERLLRSLRWEREDAAGKTADSLRSI